MDRLERPPKQTRGPERLLVGCDREQVEAITTSAQPLCILAGAGSGKTRVLTRRVAWRVLEGSADSKGVLCLTFTRKAAAELRARLGSLGLREPVAAGTFHAIALAELRRLARERRELPPVVLSSKARVIRDVIDGARLRGVEPDRLTVREVAGELDWAKSRLLPPERYEEEARRARRLPQVGRPVVSALYQSYERELRRRRVVDFEDLLTRCSDELERDEEFAASTRWRIRHLFVDEYQDVNAAQLRLLDAWCSATDDLCVVGDPNQAIYSWNGADPHAITQFPEKFPNATVLELQANYRSTAEVVTIAASVLGVARAPVTSGPVPEGSVPSVSEYEDEEAEAEGVVALARRAHRPGRSWSNIAVLARTNAQLQVFSDAFAARNVPSQVVGDETLADRSLLSDASPDADLEAADELGAEAGPERADAVRTGNERVDAVQLLSFHRAKGLEWPVVFVTGLEDGYVPISYATDAPALAEERRLLYVACTRAAEELYCSWARTRRFGGGRATPRSPSPYLAPIDQACGSLAASSRPSKALAREAIAESRRALADDGSASRPPTSELG